jgi:hypothetical protein
MLAGARWLQRVASKGVARRQHECVAPGLSCLPLAGVTEGPRRLLLPLQGTAITKNLSRASTVLSALVLGAYRGGLALVRAPPHTHRSGQILACLKDVRVQISKQCRSELFKVMMDVSGIRPKCIGDTGPQAPSFGGMQ